MISYAAGFIGFMKMKKKFLEVRENRPGFTKQFKKREGYEIYNLDFCLNYVVKGGVEDGSEVITGFHHKEKLDKAVETIVSGDFDAVFCEDSATAFLLEYVILRTKQNIIPFFIGNFNNLQRAKTVCEWIECVYGENPFEEIIRHPMNLWFYSAHVNAEFLSELGVPNERMFYIPASIFMVNTLLSDIRVLVGRLKVAWDDKIIRSVRGNMIACGNNQRDYKTLVDAVRGLPWNLIIFCDAPFFHVSPVPENVRVHPYVSLRKFYQVLSVSQYVIIPLIETHETIGIVTAGMAMAHGKPVISTQLAWMNEYVIDGYNGFLVKPYDVEGMKRAVVSLAGDTERVKRMGANALIQSQKLCETAKENFNRMYEQALLLVSQEKRCNRIKETTGAFG